MMTLNICKIIGVVLLVLWFILHLDINSKYTELAKKNDTKRFDCITEDFIYSMVLLIPGIILVFC